MDEALYNGVLAALEAVHGGHTVPEARQVAGQMLEGFKDREDGMAYALYILQTPSPRHTDSVRHFALHCLEHMIKVRWLPVKDDKNILDAKGLAHGRGGGERGRGEERIHSKGEATLGQTPQLTLAEKEQLKDAMLQVMARGTRDVGQEAQFIKIKVADLVAQLAERDYPNRWEGFLDQMMQAWTTGPTQAELAMMVLARLVEDCHDVDFRSEIDFSRRDPILRGLNAFLPQLIPTLYNFLVQQWMGYKAAAAAAAASPSAPAAAAAAATAAAAGGVVATGAGATEGALINRALDLLSKILPWALDKTVNEKSNDFLPAMAQLSTLRVARSGALVCLEAMCSQKLSVQHFERLMEHLPDIVRNVKQALAQEGVLLSESLEVHQMLSACLEETLIRGTNFIAGDREFQDRNSRKSELLSNFLQQLLQLTQMPSKRMAGNLIQAWQSFAHKPNAKEMPAFVVLVPQLLAAFASHSVTVRFDDDVTDDFVAAEEFVDEEDYYQFLKLFKEQVKLLQLQLGKLNPLHTVRYVLEQAQTLLQHQATGTDNLNPLGFPTWKTEACRSWGTFASLATGTIVGLPSWCTGKKPKNPEELVEGGTTAIVSVQCFDMLRTMTDLIIKWQPRGSVLVCHQLTVLESCKLLFANEPAMLQAVFDKLFSLLEASDPSINITALPPGASAVTASPEVEAVREAASKALVVLATGVSALLVVALEGIYQRVQGVINNNRPSLAVRTHLLELLVVVSNSVKDESQRRAFVLGMLKEPMSVWVGEEVTSAVSSPNQLLARLGITPNLPADPAAYAPNSPLTQQAWLAFQTLRSPLTVLLGLGLRVSAGDERSFQGDLDAMVRGGMDGLGAVNPFAAAWSQALPNIVNLTRSVHMLWAPPTRGRLLSHPIARAVLAMIPSGESEACRRKSKSGDYEISAQDLRKLPLVSQWCRMLHDLRTVCYNLLGLACKQGALYLAIPASKVQDVVVGGILAGLEYVENRHFPGMCSRFLEKYVVFCPPCLVRSHVRPVMSLLARNIMPRLSAAWSPHSVGAQNLRASDPEKFQVYADGGAMLTQEDLDKDELDELRTKHRQMITRGLADLMHSCLGLKGELHIVEPAQEKSTTSYYSMSKRSGNNNSHYNNQNSNHNSREERGKKANTQAEKANGAKRKRRRVILDTLLRSGDATAPSAPNIGTESETAGIPPSFVMFAVGLIKHWGDPSACRKALAIATLVVEEYDLRSDVMRQRLSRDLFSALVDSLVDGSPHLQGLEWDAVILTKNLYCSFGMSGASGTSTPRLSRATDMTLRKKLLSLPGVIDSDISSMESKLKATPADNRKQKEAVRDVLRRAAIVSSAVANRSGDKASSSLSSSTASTSTSSSFWQENKGRSGGAKGQSNNSRSERSRNRRVGNGSSSHDDNSDNPSSDILWKRQQQPYRR